MSSSYLINALQFICFSALENELKFETGKNYLFDLAYLSSLTVQGERAAEFLQGQLSCDLRQVNKTSVRQGALCNLKGRVLTLADVLDWQDLQLVLAQDLIEPTLASLSQAATLDRVTLESSTTYPIFGFYGPNPKD